MNAAILDRSQERKPYAFVTQLAEYPTLNRKVADSSSAGSTIYAHSSKAEQQTFNLWVADSSSAGRTKYSISLIGEHYPYKIVAAERNRH